MNKITSSSVENENKIEVEKSDGGHNEFLVFQLSHEEYAIDVLKIQEIRHYESIITIANSPLFLKGALNMRGTIVPLIDLRILFHLERCEYTERTIFIILNLREERVLGIVTDGVSDVIKLTPEQIKKTREFKTIIHNDFIKGVGILENRALIIIDIEKLFSLDELHGLDKIFSINHKKSGPEKINKN